MPALNSAVVFELSKVKSRAGTRKTRSADREFIAPDQGGADLGGTTWVSVPCFLSYSAVKISFLRASMAGQIKPSPGVCDAAVSSALA